MVLEFCLDLLPGTMLHEAFHLDAIPPSVSSQRITDCLFHLDGYHRGLLYRYLLYRRLCLRSCRQVLEPEHEGDVRGRDRRLVRFICQGRPETCH